MRQYLSPFIFALGLVLVVGASAANDDPRAGLPESAREAALTRLIEDLMDEELARGVTVAGFARAVDAEAALRDALRGTARPVGGPRWLDEFSCQVRVDASLGPAAQVLLRAALAQPHRSPLAYRVLEQRLSRWHQRSLSATAVSISPDRMPLLRPVDDDRPEWRGVEDASRVAALDAARRDAGRRVAETLFAVPISDPAPARGGPEGVAAWATSRPITAVRFRADRSVEVGLAVPRDELERVAREAAGEEAWPTVSTRLGAVPGVVTGLGRADAVDAADRARDTRTAGRALPVDPPAWVDQLLSAEGESAFAGSPLKTARSAERAALETLRAAVAGLPFDSQGTPVGTAHPAAVDRAIASAGVAQVKYRADGSVQLRVTLPARVVWHELQNGGASP